MEIRIRMLSAQESHQIREFFALCCERAVATFSVTDVYFTILEYAQITAVWHSTRYWIPLEYHNSIRVRISNSCGCSAIGVHGGSFYSLD